MMPNRMFSPHTSTATTQASTYRNEENFTVMKCWKPKSNIAAKKPTSRERPPEESATGAKPGLEVGIWCPSGAGAALP